MKTAILCATLMLTFPIWARSAKPSLVQLKKQYQVQKDPALKFQALASILKIYASSSLSDKDLNEVEQQARELLKLAVENQGNADYGNAVHHANLVLGRLALRRGHMPEAEDFLHRAGDAPSSSQLISHGPNMMLAKELLEKGRKDSVLQYFDQVGKFWEFSDQNPKNGLTIWKKQVRAGKIPNFGANLE